MPGAPRPGIKVPAVVLEIVAGIVVGPSVLGWVEIDQPIAVLALVGVAFLLFLAGLEIDLLQFRGDLLRLTTLGFAMALVLASALGSPSTLPAGCAARSSSPSPSRQRRSASLCRCSRTPGSPSNPSGSSPSPGPGKANCRCHDEPPQLHGPYHQWTRTADGKPLTRLLGQDLAERYQPWFDSARRLRATLSELEALSIAVVERDRQTHS